MLSRASALPIDHQHCLVSHHSGRLLQQDTPLQQQLPSGGVVRLDVLLKCNQLHDGDGPRMPSHSFHMDPVIERRTFAYRTSLQILFPKLQLLFENRFNCLRRLLPSHLAERCLHFCAELYLPNELQRCGRVVCCADGSFSI
eukprot:TRINITY_DN16327_c0_g1_i1.p1 TRINITY_DN16327_c0_g1~~TRINITY_DN16327_c0_g1_i1.p1  ORF type:complete len:142 (-),score=7.89 TRINITY_DN16327_c0_g1_i1:41-466(-)